MELNKNKITTMDINLLLSIVNMKLRDEFSTLDSLCKRYDLDEDTLKNRLSSGGFTYNTENNQFIRKK